MAACALVYPCSHIPSLSLLLILIYQLKGLIIHSFNQLVCAQPYGTLMVQQRTEHSSYPSRSFRFCGQDRQTVHSSTHPTNTDCVCVFHGLF